MPRIFIFGSTSKTCKHSMHGCSLSTSTTCTVAHRGQAARRSLSITPLPSARKRYQHHSNRFRCSARCGIHAPPKTHRACFPCFRICCTLCRSSCILARFPHLHTCHHQSGGESCKLGSDKV